MVSVISLPPPNRPGRPGMPGRPGRNGMFPGESTTDMRLRLMTDALNRLATAQEEANKIATQKGLTPDKDL